MSNSPTGLAILFLLWHFSYPQFVSWYLMVFPVVLLKPFIESYLLFPKAGQAPCLWTSAVFDIIRYNFIFTSFWIAFFLRLLSKHIFVVFRSFLLLPKTPFLYILYIKFCKILLQLTFALFHSSFSLDLEIAYK